jgi:hypothetical protein
MTAAEVSVLVSLQQAKYPKLVTENSLWNALGSQRSRTLAKSILGLKIRGASKQRLARDRAAIRSMTH